MLKRFIWVAVAALFFVFQLNTNSAQALELDQDTLTVKADDSGETLVLNSETYALGQRLFIENCTQCHLQGKTKTNNNVSLSLSDLAGAEPSRDNIEGLIDYLENPTSYDGETDLSLEHINVSRPDIFPEIRNYTDEDVKAVAGYMLVAPKLDKKWGGSIYY